MKQKVAAVILGAGKGTRMHSDKPKVLMPVCGKTMVRRIIDTLESIPVDEIVTVISPDGKDVAKEVAPYATCVQELQLGTGHAVNCAKDFCKMLGIFDAIKRFYHITIKGDWKKHYCNNKICRWCGRYE